ncbi:MAG: hypothetical protein AB7P52_04765 [Alphaproteobacteria bacterium]
MRYALTLAAVPACLVALSSVTASAADEAELERVRSAVAEAIAPSDDPEMPRLELAEPVSAAWRGEHIVVSLKQAKLVEPAEQAELVIGDIELAVLPQGDGRYAFDVAMPQRFEALEHGVPEGAVTISTYKIGGIWAAEVGSLVKLDLSLAGIEVQDLTPETTNFGAVLGTLDARLDYSKGVDGLWSGTSSLNLAGLKVHTEDSPGESDDFMLAALESSSTTKGWDWNTWHKLAAKLEQSVTPGATPLTDEEKKALANEVRSINWGANDGVMTLKGLSVGAAGEHLFDLGEFTWKLGFDGANDAGPLSMRLSMAGLAVTENELPPNLAPSKAAFDVTLEQFPMRAFLGSMLSQFIVATSMAPESAPAPAEEGEPTPDGSDGMGMDEPAEPEMTEPEMVEPEMTEPEMAEPEMAEAEPAEAEPQSPGPGEAPDYADEPGYQDEYPDEYDDSGETPPSDEYGGAPMMGPLPMDDPFFQSVFALGTAIVLNELSVDAASAGMVASGRVDVDPEAIGMGTGKVKATLRGIDSVLAYVESEARSQPDMKDISTFLIFLKGLGRAEVGANNEIVYVYDINVPKDEPPTVNGYLIDDMMFE